MQTCKNGKTLTRKKRQTINEINFVDYNAGKSKCYFQALSLHLLKSQSTYEDLFFA